MHKLVGLITQFEVLYWEENVLPHSVEAEHEILGRWLSLRATNKWQNQIVKWKLNNLKLYPQKRKTNIPVYQTFVLWRDNDGEWKSGVFLAR